VDSIAVLNEMLAELTDDANQREFRSSEVSIGVSPESLTGGIFFELPTIVETSDSLRGLGP
jgi:hypothetical protein